MTNKGRTIVETTNRVSYERDVTRHAEIVAISEAQRRLGCTSLDDCTLYANVEPCALCSYAIRETRISRVVFGLSSPVMGGHSRWNILGDPTLSAAMPEVFAPPPDVCANFLSDEADAALRRASPILWAVTRSRGLFVCEARSIRLSRSKNPTGGNERAKRPCASCAGGSSIILAAVAADRRSTDEVAARRERHRLDLGVNADALGEAETLP